MLYELSGGNKSLMLSKAIMGRRRFFRARVVRSNDMSKVIGGYIYEKVFYIGIRYGRTSR